MKKMRKSFSLIAVLVCAVLCTQISAYAAEAEPDVSAISNAEIVSVSEESTTYIVNEEIAVIETVREVEYVPVVQRASTASWTYKDYTRSKYFYIIVSTLSFPPSTKVILFLSSGCQACRRCCSTR